MCVFYIIFHKKLSFLHNFFPKIIWIRILRHRWRRHCCASRECESSECCTHRARRMRRFFLRCRERIFIK